jgi:hypothetical protein
MRTAALLSIMVGALLGVGCERLSVPSEGDASELIGLTDDKWEDGLAQWNTR